jgi:N-acetylglutamate synthase-like GNAT family acetyltransferase
MQHILEASGVLKLRAASVTEADELTALCLRAKAVWGYDNEFMEACRAELTVTPERIGKSSFQVAEIDSNVVGFTQLSCMGGGVAELNSSAVKNPEATDIS